jgi:hypothetical protein
MIKLEIFRNCNKSPDRRGKPVQYTDRVCIVRGGNGSSLGEDNYTLMRPGR